MQPFWDADFGPGFWIATRSRGPGLQSEYTEAAQLYALASDQGGCNLLKNGGDDLLDVPVVQMRVLSPDPRNQFRFDHAAPPAMSMVAGSN